MTSLKELLLRAKGLSEGEIASLPDSLEGKTEKGSLFSSEYPLKLTSLLRKADTAEHLIMTGMIGTV